MRLATLQLRAEQTRVAKLRQRARVDNTTGAGGAIDSAQSLLCLELPDLMHVKERDLPASPSFHGLLTPWLTLTLTSLLHHAKGTHPAPNHPTTHPITHPITLLHPLTGTA